MPLALIATIAASLFLAVVLLAWLANDGPYRLRVRLRKWQWDRESRMLRLRERERRARLGRAKNG